MNRTRRRVGTLLAAIAALLVATAPPVAADPPLGPNITLWNSAPCVVPRFDSVVIDHHFDLVVVIGSATECPPTVTNGGFRLAGYLPGEAEGVSEGYNVRLFPPKSDAPAVVRPFGAAVVPSAPGDYGVCLLAGANERRLCAKVSNWIGEDKELRTDFKEIPVNDVLVAKGVRLKPYNGKVSPPSDLGGTCGSCF